MSSNQENNPPIAGALTYPSSSEQNAQPIPDQPRQPRNLQGLLRFAMEATKAEDAPGVGDLGPMDEERRKFLEEALRSMTVDLVQVLQGAIKVLSDRERMTAIKQGDKLPDDVNSAFANLLEFLDDIDISNDFYKMGGFAIFPACYSSDNEEVRANASWVLAEVCQNNPYCQARALDCGLLAVLLGLAASERGAALAKCIYAISCTCRECPAACAALLRGGGGALAAALRAQHAPARKKAAYFLRYLCQQHADAKEALIKENIIEIIAEQLKSDEQDSTTEPLLGILVALTEDEDPRVLEQCRDPRFELKTTLQQLSEYEDEAESCQILLVRIFEGCPQVEGANPSQNDEEADR